MECWTTNYCTMIKADHHAVDTDKGGSMKTDRRRTKGKLVQLGHATAKKFKPQRDLFQSSSIQPYRINSIQPRPVQGQSDLVEPTNPTNPPRELQVENSLDSRVGKQFLGGINSIVMLRGVKKKKNKFFRTGMEEGNQCNQVISLVASYSSHVLRVTGYVELSYNCCCARA